MMIIEEKKTYNEKTAETLISAVVSTRYLCARNDADISFIIWVYFAFPYQLQCSLLSNVTSSSFR